MISRAASHPGKFLILYFNFLLVMTLSSVFGSDWRDVTGLSVLVAQPSPEHACSPGYTLPVSTGRAHGS